MQDLTAYSLLESMIPPKLLFKFILEGPYWGEGVKNFSLKQRFKFKSGGIQQ